MTAEMARLIRERQLLSEVHSLLVTHARLSDIIRSVVEQIGQIYRYSFVSVYLIKDNVLQLQHQVNYDSTITQLPLSQGVMGRVVRTGEAVLLRDKAAILSDPDFVAALEGITGEICMALFDGVKVVGTLNVETLSDLPFNEDDLALMKDISDLLGIAVHHSRLVQEVEQNSQQYQSLLNSLNEIIFQLDGQGNFLFINPAWERVMGYTVEETLGTPVMRYIHPDDAGLAGEVFVKFFNRSLSACTREGHYRTQSGGERWLMCNARLVENEAGEVRVIGSFIDITKRRQAEENGRLQQQLVVAFSDTAEALTTTLSMNEMFDFVFSNLRRVMPPFQAVRAMLIDGDALVVVRAEGYEVMTGNPPAPPQRYLYREVPRWQKMIEAGEAYSIADLRLIPDGVITPGLEWVRSVMGAPLRTNERVIGSIHLESDTPNQFGPIHAEWLQAFADLVGAAVQNAQMYTAVRSHAEYLEERVAERTAAFQRAKTQVEKILNASSDSILLIDTHGRVQQVNPAFTQLAGYESDKAFGQLLISFADRDSVEMLQHGIASALGGEPSRIEVIMQRSNETYFTVDAALDPIRTYKGDVAIVCTLHDITERRRIETELRSALEDERRLNELKTRFSITVSHEFRTPLQIIQSSSDKLLHYFERMSQEGRNEALHNIEAQIQHLKNLLEDVMTISKADTIGLEFEPVMTDVGQFVEGIVREMRWVASSRHRIYYTAPEWVNAPLDVYLMRRVLNNLLSNAIKYSLDGTAIHVAVSSIDNDLCIEVRDQGIGIPEVDQDKVFEMFHRAENAEHLPGTGLGLAIVKRSVELHGGSIDFQSRAGQGTTFIIHLPLERTQIVKKQ